ncbi:LOW QUALITY PROTEIN: uncharacterized protein EMH_0048410 [Eimeria mitis]|uniref:Uncharacterized protein n=1 Tax=Eimeria mitis TaxID=44415 RepID=U6JZ08_9EIME|nr:LOW QUALITY PROTEIN: uncharacterized protein EMH_0048410 [Eimeria mitis]CDJ29287.1 hypothetical protein, conserved [Eimeria mitis]
MRRAYRGTESNRRTYDPEQSSESEGEHAAYYTGDSSSEMSSDLRPNRPHPTPEPTSTTHYTQPQHPYSSAYQQVLGKVHEFEASDDDSDWEGPSSGATTETPSTQQQGAAPPSTAAPNTEGGERSTERGQTSSPQTSTPAHHTTVVVASVHQPPVQQADGHHPPTSPPSSVGPFGNNAAVAQESTADAISDASSVSSRGSERRRSVHGDASSSSSGTEQQHGDTREKTNTLSDLVSKGVGSELLNCIELPLGYQELDSKVDDFCRLIKKKGIRYPNHPTQTACRKGAKHVVTQLRRVYSECNDGIYNCLTKFWLSPAIPGVTKLRSLMGIPHLAKPGLLESYIIQVLESPQLMKVWRHPNMESNSCIFGHQYEAFVVGTPAIPTTSITTASSRFINVANGDIDAAKRKARNFSQDLKQAKEDWEDVEKTQAIARVHAAMSVTLSKFLANLTPVSDLKSS